MNHVRYLFEISVILTMSGDSPVPWLQFQTPTTLSARSSCKIVRFIFRYWVIMSTTRYFLVLLRYWWIAGSINRPIRTVELNEMCDFVEIPWSNFQLQGDKILRDDCTWNEKNILIFCVDEKSKLFIDDLHYLFVVCFYYTSSCIDALNMPIFS